MLSSPGKRKDNSLGKLTAKFMALVAEAPDLTVDLNEAAQRLQVQKRRIYDITNVLEGVNLIEKQSKNIIRFQALPALGSDGSSEEEEQGGSEEEADEDRAPAAPVRATLVPSSHPDEMALVRAQEAALDERLAHQQRALSKLLQGRAQWAYVRHEDMRSVPSLREQTIIAVRAETGTRLEVPDPDEGMLGAGGAGAGAGSRRRYQIYLKSTSAIDVFLVSLLDSELLEMEAQHEHIAAALSQRQGPPPPVPPTLSGASEAPPSLLRPPTDLNVDYFFNTQPHEGVADYY